MRKASFIRFSGLAFSAALLAASAALTATVASAQPTQPAPSSPASLPAPEKTPWTLPANVQLNFDIEGKIKGLSYSASSALKWQAEGERYHLRLDTKLPILGTRSQVSDGLITAYGISPNSYSEQMRKTNTATVARSERRIDFNTGRPSAEWHEGAQDRLSVMLQIGQWLRDRPQRYKTGDVVDVQVIGPRSAPVWHFRVDGTESVALASGKVDALKFTRLPRDGKADDDQVIEFWLSPAYQQLPVRLRWSEDGDGADQLLTSASGLK